MKILLDLLLGNDLNSTVFSRCDNMDKCFGWDHGSKILQYLICSIRGKRAFRIISIYSDHVKSSYI